MVNTIPPMKDGASKCLGGAGGAGVVVVAGATVVVLGYFWAKNEEVKKNIII